MPDFIFGIIVIALILLAIIAGTVIYDSTRFVTEEYVITSDKLRKNCKIVMLSDLHNKNFGKENDKLLNAIDEINPDMIIIAGDMLTANEKKTKYTVPVKLLKSLSQKYQIYYGNGNHEYRMKVYLEGYGDMYKQYKAELLACGVQFLENERIFLPERNMEICGLEIEKYYYKRFYLRPMSSDYIKKLLGNSRPDCFELLIAHNPDYFKEYAEWGADLTFSGHVHGGVMKLPYIGGVISPMMRLFPKYDGGQFEEKGCRMILGRGLGMHTIPVRIFNPGEIVVVNLTAD